MLDGLIGVEGVDEWDGACGLLEVAFELGGGEGAEDAAFCCFDHCQEVLFAVDVVVEVYFVQQVDAVD